MPVCVPGRENHPRAVYRRLLPPLFSRVQDGGGEVVGFWGGEGGLGLHLLRRELRLRARGRPHQPPLCCRGVPWQRLLMRVAQVSVLCGGRIAGVERSQVRFRVPGGAQRGLRKVPTRVQPRGESLRRGPAIHLVWQSACPALPRRCRQLQLRLDGLTLRQTTGNADGEGAKWVAGPWEVRIAQVIVRCAVRTVQRGRSGVAAVATRLFRRSFVRRRRWGAGTVSQSANARGPPNWSVGISRIFHMGHGVGAA